MGNVTWRICSKVFEVRRPLDFAGKLGESDKHAAGKLGGSEKNDGHGTDNGKGKKRRAAEMAKPNKKKKNEVEEGEEKKQDRKDEESGGQSRLHHAKYYRYFHCNQRLRTLFDGFPHDSV